jgi:hypothetical protein
VDLPLLLFAAAKQHKSSRARNFFGAGLHSSANFNFRYSLRTSSVGAAGEFHALGESWEVTDEKSLRKLWIVYGSGGAPGAAVKALAKAEHK